MKFRYRNVFTGATFAVMGEEAAKVMDTFASWVRA